MSDTLSIMINTVCTLVIAKFFGRPFFETAILLLCDQLYMQEQGLAVILIASKKVIEGIALAILSSFVFTFIMNRGINSETYLSEEVDHATNYFMFSFGMEGFPKTFWKHFLGKSEKYLDNDLLRVIVIGKANGLGGYFRAERRYSLHDIVVDIHEPEKRFKKKVKNIITLKERYRIDWKEFPKCIEAGKSERQDIINEIQNFCYPPSN